MNQNVWDRIRPVFSFLYKIITSEQTQRLALSSFVFSSAITTLFVSSLFVYCIFYALWMPEMGYQVPVYMDYALATPQAQVELPGFQKDSLYNFHVHLNVPDSENNLMIGNFMVELSLYSDQTLLHYSKRPAMIQYKSSLLRSIETYYRLLSLLSGSRQSQTLDIHMIEGFQTNQPVDKAVIALSTPDLQTYAVHLQIETQFQGLTYFMYHWWFSTGIFFVSVIMLFKAVLMAQIYQTLTQLPEPTLMVAPAEPGREYEPLLKLEHEEIVEDTFTPPVFNYSFTRPESPKKDASKGMSFSQPYQFAPQNVYEDLPDFQVPDEDDSSYSK
ncbi:putative adipose-regulatory protein-domain-containing protein [Gorgonomyces haynaldii]|nr:putative adipose-regulatory protein-domain-containing protein [Gorgonomyces haynaldii]